MTHLGAALMTDMEKDTVDFCPPITTRRAPNQKFSQLRFLTCLLTGGPASQSAWPPTIPPHNLVEVIDGICEQIDNPDITLDELMQHVKGPDFPTGLHDLWRQTGFANIFETGRGSMKVRGKAGVEELKAAVNKIVITQIPYGVNRATLVERIAQLVNERC